MGPGSVSSQGDADVREANHIAREMIFTCGFSRGLGPVALMEPARLSTPYSDDESAASTAQVGSAVARIALGEVDEVCTPLFLSLSFPCLYDWATVAATFLLLLLMFLWQGCGSTMHGHHAGLVALWLKSVIWCFPDSKDMRIKPGMTS